MFVYITTVKSTKFLSPSKALKKIHSTCFTSGIYHFQTDYCNRVKPKDQSMPILY